MKTVNKFFMCALLGVIGYGCAPKYTASFGPSKPFYEDKKETALDNQVIAEAKVEKVEEELEVKESQPSLIETNTDKKNIETVEIEKLTTSLSEKPVLTTPKAEQLEEKYINSNKLSVKEINKLSGKEKKKLFREIKKDLKEIKKLKKKSSIENRKIYAGIIIALAGILVAILVSGTIGGLGILVGIILIAWGLIEQGTLS